MKLTTSIKNLTMYGMNDSIRDVKVVPHYFYPTEFKLHATLGTI